MIFSNLTLFKIWYPRILGISGKDIYTSNSVLKKLVTKHNFTLTTVDSIDTITRLHGILPDQKVVFYISKMKERTLLVPLNNFVKNGLVGREYFSYNFTKSKTFSWLKIL